MFIKRHFKANYDEKEKSLHEGLSQLIQSAHIYNGWFIKEFIEEALKNIAAMLEEKSISDFTKNIPEPKQQKTVALIDAIEIDKNASIISN